ncbi:MAG TPA: GNAT family N-acetyltransferase [Allosphingosinicella sp.]|jgi:RimJ/RimL family protein N-acetyltransferase
MTVPQPNVRLRRVENQDVQRFHEHECDSAASWLAAFCPAEPPDLEPFTVNWATILAENGARTRTVLADGEVAGYITSFVQMGQPSISYWIGRHWWGRGVATKALAAFLVELTERPLYARVVKDNLGSRRVLEKNGFRICGEDRGFAPIRRAEVEEWILSLE